MKAEDIYKLGPDCVTEKMIEVACDFIGPGFTKKHEQLAKRILEVGQQYYRLGAFNMEHKDSAKCMAEDQGGWPCCGQPAEYFVKAERADGRRIVYCSEHQDNRFYSPEHMSPIYKNPKDA